MFLYRFPDLLYTKHIAASNETRPPVAAKVLLELSAADLAKAGGDRALWLLLVSGDLGRADAVGA